MTPKGGSRINMKLSFVVSQKERPQAAYQELRRHYDDVPQSEADAIVVLGGDGMMLRALHSCEDCDKPFYGMNLGTLGFLHNHYSVEDLPGRIERAKKATIHPLRLTVTDLAGEEHMLLAYNEAALFRENRPTAHIEVKVNGVVRIDKLNGDGVLVSTPMGSTAYSYSAGGPILPLSANLLAVTPLNPFRPRNWRGALISNREAIEFKVLTPEDRRVGLTADYKEIRDIVHVEIHESRSTKRALLFDPGSELGERMLREQFPVE